MNFLETLKDRKKLGTEMLVRTRKELTQAKRKYTIHLKKMARNFDVDELHREIINAHEARIDRLCSQLDLIEVLTKEYRESPDYKAYKRSLTVHER